MVDILLATYNGSRFLREQLDSLLRQSYRDFRILIRDDGSGDDTRDILHAYKLRHSDCIAIIEDDVHCGSPTKNFLQLLQHATAPYVMFCDQDDFWFPDKVARMLARMRVEDARRGGEEPLLLFSDYEPVDAALHRLPIREDSLQVAKHYRSLPRLLVQNYVTGCTVMINRAAARLAGAYDPRMQMHDWWLALCVSAMGRVVHMPEKLMYYRQHGGNDVGAKDVTSWSYRIEKLRDPATRHAMQKNFAQAQLLFERHGDRLPADHRAELTRFLAIQAAPKPLRAARLIRGGYLKSDFVRTAGELILT